MANTTLTEIASTEKRILNNLPPRVQPFVDREAEIERVTELLLAPDVPIVSIVGMAGVGKTALALEVVLRLMEQGQFPDGACWLYCRNRDQALSEILEAVQRTFDLETRTTLRDAVRRFLGEHRVLLVLDEYDAIADDFEVLSFLGRLSGSSKVLLTSRTRTARLSRTGALRLDGLNLKDGIHLFRQVVESYGATVSATEEASIAQIVRLLQGHPWAVRLAAVRVGATALAPQILLEQIEREAWPDARNILSTVVYTLSQQAKELFRRLAVFAADFSEQAIDAICQVDGWQQAVRDLQQASLVQRQGERYQLHTLARAAALAELEKHDERKVYERRAAGYHLQLAQAAESKIHDGELSTAADVVRTEFDNMLAGQEWYWAHEHWQEVIEYGSALANLLALGDFQEARLAVVQRALEASRRSGDIGAEARFLSALADINQLQGSLLEAVDLYEQSLAFFRQVGNRLGEANTLIRLADVHLRMDDLERATALYEIGLALFRQIGDRFGEANALGTLADIYVRQSDYLRARELYEISLALFRQIGARLGEANTLSSLANIYQRLGDYQRATELYEVGLALFRQVGDRLGEANTLSNLGNTYQRLADYQRARELYEVSLALFRQVGDRLAEANTLSNLANIFQAQGRPREAIDLYETTLPILQQAGDRYGEAVVLHSLGVAYQSLGQLEQARSYYESSLALKELVGDRQGIAVTLQQLGSLAQDRGAFSEAQEYYAQAAVIAESIGDIRLLAIADARQGMVFEHQARYAESLALLDRSSELFERIGDSANVATVQRSRVRILDKLEEKEFDETVAAFTKVLTFSVTAASQDLEVGAARSIVEYGKRLVAQGRYRDTLYLMTRLSTELEKIEQDATGIIQVPLSPRDVEMQQMLLREPPPTYQTLIRYDQQVLKTAGLTKSILSVIARVAAAQIGSAPTRDYDAALQALEIGRQVDKTTGQAFQLAQWVREVSGFEFVELEDADDWPPTIAYLVHLAARYERDENWGAAIDAYHQACDLLDQPKSEEQLLRSTEIGFRLALCLKQAGRWSEALKQQEENVAQYKKLSDLQGKANTYMEMGHIYQMMNLYDPALLYYGEAYYLYRQAAEETTDETVRRTARHGMVNAKESLGNLEFQLNVLPKGVTDLEEARQIYLDLDMPGKAAIISQTLEDVQVKQGGQYA